jgi:subtilisin
MEQSNFTLIREAHSMSLQSAQEQIKEIGAANIVVVLNPKVLRSNQNPSLIDRGRFLREAPAIDDSLASELSRIFDLGWTALPDTQSAALKEHESFSPAISRLVGGGSPDKNQSPMRYFPNLGIIYGSLTQEGLGALQDHSAVDKIHHALEELSLIQPEPGGKNIKPPAAEMIWGIKRMHAKDIWEKGYTGRDILVAHLDTGVDSEHPALKGAISDHIVVSLDGEGTEPQNPYLDSADHGTHTAGVIAGRRDANEPIIGMAPDARLACATVINEGKAVLRVLTGMDWAVGSGARILNMSLGFKGWNGSFEDIMRNLRANNVLPVVAIGNGGTNKSRSPGNYTTALSVGAVDQNDEVAYFSGNPRPGAQGAGPLLCAPGINITSAYSGGGYQEETGTSVATPHIAGLAALLFDAKPKASIDQVQEAIVASCEKGEGVDQSRIGAGIPNGKKVLSILDRIMRR